MFDANWVYDYQLTYVWMGGEPVAFVVNDLNADGSIAQTATYYVHSDHLARPLKLSDQSQGLPWGFTPREAFGTGYVSNGNPFTGAALISDAEFNLRFPGQYQDDESGFLYNYYRTYDPSTGRYLESDPIGLNGGLNTYGYVAGNPLSYYDPYGLFGMDDVYGAIYNATDGWSPSQGAVDAWAGFGDGVSSVATLGFYSTADLREDWDIDGGVDECSQTYRNSKYVGYAWGAATGAGAAGRALGVRANFRSQGNVFKIISTRLRTGFRIDPAHHGKPWGHTHWWRW